MISIRMVLWESVKSPQNTSTKEDIGRKKAGHLWQKLATCQSSAKCASLFALKLKAPVPRESLKIFLYLAFLFCCAFLKNLQQYSETGRIRFWGVRFQTPSSVSFFGAHWVPGSELSEFLSAYYLCAKANSPSFSQNSPSLPRNSVRLSEFSSQKQYSRNSIPPVS